MSSVTTDFAAFVKQLELAQQATGRDLARIVDAFDYLESGVILYGPDDCVVFCNRRFREINLEVADLLVPGTAFETILRAFYRRRFQKHAQLDEDEFVRLRVAKHLNPDEGGYEFKLGEDRCILASDRRTADGGIIGFRLDITERKKPKLRWPRASHVLRRC